MDTGRLADTRLTLLRPVRVTDRMGAERTTYEEAGFAHAERQSFTGRRSEEAGEHFPDYTARFNVRAEHAVTEFWRVKDLDGTLYTVVAVALNRWAHFKTLFCERVNL